MCSTFYKIILFLFLIIFFVENQIIWDLIKIILFTGALIWESSQK